MGKIATYPIVTPQGDDKIIVSQTTGTPEDATKNITVDGLASYIGAGAGNGIPTPEMSVVKVRENFGIGTAVDTVLCIDNIVGTNQAWLDPANEARLFMYTKRPTKVRQESPKGGGWTHPSHNNGEFLRQRFGESVNWCASPQEKYAPLEGAFREMPDIVTEWDIANDLEILGTGDSADFSDPNLRPLTKIKVPFNQLQFIVSQNPTGGAFDTPTEIGVNGIDLSKNTTRNSIRAPFKANFGIWNTVTPQNLVTSLSMKIIMKFKIGIINPDFTLTNHTVPYILSEFSNPITLVYQTNNDTAPDWSIRKALLADGISGSVSRRIAF